MLSGGRRVHADSKQHMEGLHFPAKRVLSMSLSNRNKKPKPAKPAKLETHSHNQTNDVYEGRSHSRAGVANNSVNLTGINNISNSCYANAVVQAIRFCPGFQEGLDRPCIFPFANGDPSLSSSLSELFTFMDLADSDSKVVVPSAFMSSLESTFPQFTFGEQHDAQELLKCLLTSLKDTANQDKTNDKSSVLENGSATAKEKNMVLPKLIPIESIAKQLHSSSFSSQQQGRHAERSRDRSESGASGQQCSPLAGQQCSPLAGYSTCRPALQHPYQNKKITFTDDKHIVQQLLGLPGSHQVQEGNAVAPVEQVVSGSIQSDHEQRKDSGASLANDSEEDVIGEDLSQGDNVLPSLSQDPSGEDSDDISEGSPMMSPEHSATKPHSPLLQAPLSQTSPAQSGELTSGQSYLTPITTPIRSMSRPTFIGTTAEITQSSGPLSPPEITERTASLAALPPAHLCHTKKLPNKARQLAKTDSELPDPGEELLVRIQRKNLKVQPPSKKRRKRPRKSQYAKKKASAPKRKVKATKSHTPYLTITSNTRAPMMVRIPLRLLRGPTSSMQHLEGLQRILHHLPLSPKTPIFDRCFRAKQFPLDSDMLSSTDFITQLFEGHLMYGTRCLECEQCTGKEESFLDLSVPIPSEAFLGSVNCKYIPLEECIEHFAASEFLSGDNKYFCGECNHLGEAERFIKLSSLPPVLVLHINRFSHNSTLHFIPKYRSQASSKLCNCIVIPETFSLERWCMRKCPTKGTVYRLYAVVFHTGISISSGHYTTAVLASVCGPRVANLVSQKGGGDSLHLGKAGSSQADSFWYYFDDEKVSILEQKHFSKMLISSSKTPYILFYCSQQDY